MLNQARLVNRVLVCINRLEGQLTLLGLQQALLARLSDSELDEDRTMTIGRTSIAVCWFDKCRQRPDSHLISSLHNNTILQRAQHIAVFAQLGLGETLYCLGDAVVLL